MLKQIIEEKHKLLKLYIIKKIKDKQKILLFLKYDSSIINFDEFSSRYKISYDSFKSIINVLIKDGLVKEVSKNNNSRKRTYKLIKPNVQIFPHASKSDEEIIYRYLHLPESAAESNPYIQISLNPHALQILKLIQTKYKSKTFKKSSIVGSSITKARAFKLLVDNKAVQKIPPKTYILDEFHDQAIQEAKLKNNPPIFNSVDLNSIVKDTKWEKFCNFHNLEISAQFEGLYEDIFHLKEYNHQFEVLSNGNKKEGIRFLKEEEEEKIEQTKVTVIAYQDKTMITIKCSEKPIYANNIIRLNKILAKIIEIINSNPHVTTKYDYDYHNFTIVKHDKALDGTVNYRLRKGLGDKYENSDGQVLRLYIKRNYKSSNSSWVRSEIRADNTKYSVHDFIAMIIDSKLNVYP